MDSFESFFARTASRNRMEPHQVKGIYYYSANSWDLTSQACSLISRGEASSEEGEKIRKTMWSPEEDADLFKGRKKSYRTQEQAKERRRYVYELKEQYPDLVLYYPW